MLSRTNFLVYNTKSILFLKKKYYKGFSFSPHILVPQIVARKLRNARRRKTAQQQNEYSFTAIFFFSDAKLNIYDNVSRRTYFGIVRRIVL